MPNPNENEGIMKDKRRIREAQSECWRIYAELSPGTERCAADLYKLCKVMASFLPRKLVEILNMYSILFGKYEVRLSSQSALARQKKLIGTPTLPFSFLSQSRKLSLLRK